MPPSVSICVPNLNMRPFLEERFRSIFAQTFADWELLVYDSYSDDGAWEYLKELASTEKRMRLWQGPREGIYPAWNACIHAARGKYVYIATSDDSMAPDCLEKLVRALEEHSACGLAHCPLHVIDEQGRPVDFPQWPGSTAFALDGGQWATRPHLRQAPFDGLLHLTGKSVYLSMVQLLIRRSLFEVIGDFPTRWGSAGDVNWQMKAGLAAATVHVPDTWAAWRIHRKQATNLAAVSQPKAREVFEDMIDNALDGFPGHPISALPDEQLAWFKTMRLYEREMEYRPTFFARRLFQATQWVSNPAVRRYLAGRALGRPDWLEAAPGLIRTALAAGGQTPVLVDLSARPSPAVDSILPSLH